MYRLEEERNKKYNKTEMMSLLFGLGQLYNLQVMTDDEMRTMQLHNALGEYDVTELMRNVRLSIILKARAFKKSNTMALYLPIVLHAKIKFRRRANDVQEDEK